MFSTTKCSEMSNHSISSLVVKWQNSWILWSDICLPLTTKSETNRWVERRIVIWKLFACIAIGWRPLYPIYQHQISQWKSALNLLRTAGRFIDQRHKGKERIISITIATRKVILMQIRVESIHWLLLKRDTIPTKHLINGKGDIGIFLSLHAYVVRNAPSWKGLEKISVKKSIFKKLWLNEVFEMANSSDEYQWLIFQCKIWVSWMRIFYA